MNAIGDVLAGMVQKSLQNQEPDDYFDDEGFLCCGNCHERKQMDVTLPAVPSIGRDAKTIRVGCLCKCGQEKADAEKADRERREFEQRMGRLRRDGITDPAYLQYTFAQDDQRNPKVSDVCRRYVENWEEMKAQNIGILFYGDVGTGKSFLACAIANALLERLVSVSVTNFPRILNSLQGSFDDERQKRIDRLQHYSLLVIDDLGVERDTSYSVEQVYNVVDTRARSGKWPFPPGVKSGTRRSRPPEKRRWAHEKKKTGPSEVEICLFLSELPERPVHQGRRQRARRRLLREGGREGRRRPSRPDPRRRRRSRRPL